MGKISELMQVLACKEVNISLPSQRVVFLPLSRAGKSGD